MAKTLVVVAGPTAIGKTSLAIKLARHFRTEIISADSRQFYREMSIGTAKPTPGELQSAKHHFIDSLSVTESFTVGDYERQSLELVQKLFEVHNILIMVGGSGLFINAVTEGFDDLPKVQPEVRDRLNKILQKDGIESIQKQLKNADPVYYQQVDRENPQRLIRALEVCISTGKPFSDFRKGNKRKRDFEVIQIGLNTSREALYKNINKRVDIMVSEGLLEEVTTLLPFKDLNALHTVGYTELFDYLDGHCTLFDAIEKIKQNTRRFAKRQLTWFNKTENIRWFEPDQVTEVLKYLHSKGLKTE